MKTLFSLIALSLIVLLPKAVFAADPTPSLTNPYCDFSGGGIPGNPVGDVTITSLCAVYEDETGVSEGNLIVDGGVITLHKKIGFSTTGQIDVVNSGIVYVNTGGTIIQGIICVKDADGDKYADTITVTTDPYGVPLTAPITQIEQKIFTTPGCPTGYTSRAEISNLTIADTDFTSIDPAKIATSDREMIRLGFTVGGITDALAAATDVQIIDKNLMVCTGGVCPTTNFATLTPATGNIYTAGKIGVGKTNPTYNVDVSGTVYATAIRNAGFDFFLGTDDQVTRGNSGTSRALVKYSADSGATSLLVVNYGGDYSGGTRIGNNTLFAANTGNSYINTGNVGIGVTNPTEKLQVAGDIYLTGAGGTIGGATLANGWLKVGTNLAMDDNEIYFGTTGYIGTIGANDLLFMTNGTEKMRVLSGGNVGIGKTNPALALDVVGASNITGNVGIGGTLTVTGNANICELKTYAAGSGTVTCTAGYYTWAGVASATGGQMLCCKVSNPI